MSTYYEVSKCKYFAFVRSDEYIKSDRLIGEKIILDNLDMELPKICSVIIN